MGYIVLLVSSLVAMWYTGAPRKFFTNGPGWVSASLVWLLPAMPSGRDRPPLSGSFFFGVIRWSWWCLWWFGRADHCRFHPGAGATVRPPARGPSSFTSCVLRTTLICTVLTLVVAPSSITEFQSQEGPFRRIQKNEMRVVRPKCARAKRTLAVGQTS